MNTAHALEDARSLLAQNERRLAALLEDVAARSAAIARTEPNYLASALRTLSDYSARASELAAVVEGQRRMLALFA
jgi:ABC-type transporter Mla subunit MlaD